MTSPRLVVATPFDGGDTSTARVTLGYHQFVRLLERELSVATTDGTVLFACDVVRARNRAAATILRELPDVTHVLWLDDDNFPEDMGDGLAKVRGMIECGEDMVGAPYVAKRKESRFIHQPIPGEAVNDRGLLKVRCVGFGFTTTTTKMLREMGQDADYYWDLPNEHEIPNIFGQTYDEDDRGRLFLASEDYAFCKRWREKGRHVWLYAKGRAIVHAGSYPYTVRDVVT
jgi:hypothetical protein